MLKSSLRAGATGLACAALGAMAIVPAQADPEPGQWNGAVGGVDISGKTFTGTGSIEFTGTYNGNIATITCTINQGLTYTAPADAPTAAPGGTISLSFDPPDNLAPENGTCTEDVTGGAVRVRATPGSVWTFNLTTPTGTSPSPNYGPFTGSITVPANSIAGTALNLPGEDADGLCTITGPTAAVTANGTYNGTTGTVASTSTPMFGLDNSQCSPAGTDALLQAASGTVWEVGNTSNHPYLVYVP